MLEVLLGVFVLVVFLIVASVFTVDQQAVHVIERFGKFKLLAFPGLNFKIPLVDKVAGRMNLRIMQLDVVIETKTLDDVFVKIIASVQYQVLKDKIYEAFYVLDNPERQIEAFVFDVVRARVPKIKLDDVFSKKDEIANSVCGELQEVMDQFGYSIIKALVTDIHPDSKVKAAMNEINEAQRLRVAAMERGEAEKILRVKQAEGEAESKILQGQGIAGQRRAIVEGLKESLGEFQEKLPDTNTKDVMSLILMAQYFDTLKEMGLHGNMNTILIPHSPSGVHDLYEQIRNAIITGNEVSKNASSKK